MTQHGDLDPLLMDLDDNISILDLCTSAQELTLDESKQSSPPSSLLQTRTTTTEKLCQMLTPNLTPTAPQHHTIPMPRCIELFNRTLNHSSSQTYRKIGAGACGTVFAADWTDDDDGVPNPWFAYKVQKATAGTGWLKRDFYRHQSILKALRGYGAQVDIPTCHFYVDAHDRQWWAKHGSLERGAEESCHLPTPVLVTDLISPLPAGTRNALIERYCKESLRAQAAADASNQDCLVRVYLGSKQGQANRRFFSLRNFKLYLNQMFEINMDVKALSEAMAEALALIHWKARTDGRDIEFVLGSKEVPDATGGRETRLFVLDFNLVRSITMDEAGVYQAVDAFVTNDPYYPRPRSWRDPDASPEERELWHVFVRKYVSTAESILADADDEVRFLPMRFIRGVACHYLGQDGYFLSQMR